MYTRPRLYNAWLILHYALLYKQYDLYSHTNLTTNLPQIYIDGLNQQSDKILNDEKLSKDRDWSHNLAGNVKKEISIDHMAIKGLPEFLATISQEYTKRVLPDYLPEGTKVAFRVWTVSQVAGECCQG